MQRHREKKHVAKSRVSSRRISSGRSLATSTSEVRLSSRLTHALGMRVKCHKCSTVRHSE